MIITRKGRCEVCQNPTSEQKEFTPTLDMFNPESQSHINASITEEVKVWRDRPIYCPEHRGE